VPEPSRRSSVVTSSRSPAAATRPWLRSLVTSGSPSPAWPAGSSSPTVRPVGDRLGGHRSDGSTAVTPAAAATAEQRLKELEKRNRQLKQENEVLRRATADFARDVLPK
jgi:hypothetical protein